MAKNSALKTDLKPAPLPVKQPIPDFDRLIHERMRLGIVSALAANATLTFNELKDLLESGTLRKYAQEVLNKSYIRAVRQASLETGLAEGSFDPESPYTLDAILGDD